MLKILIGFFVGCFFTYNFILPNENYIQMFDDVNIYILDFLYTTTEIIENNVKNR